MNMVIKNEGDMYKTMCHFLVVEGELIVEIVISGIYRTDVAKNRFQMRHIKFYPVWKN